MVSWWIWGIFIFVVSSPVAGFPSLPEQFPSHLAKGGGKAYDLRGGLGAHFPSSPAAALKVAHRSSLGRWQTEKDFLNLFYSLHLRYDRPLNYCLGTPVRKVSLYLDSRTVAMEVGTR